MKPLFDATALRAIPIFPLPDSVLLPRSLVPLHVFEPRYLAMTRDVVAGAGLMGIARLKPGYEPFYQGRPPVHAVFGVGRVVAAETTAEGRYNILLAGVARATILRELPPTRAYREVEADVLGDDACEEPAVLRSKADQLIAVCDRLADVLPAGGSELRQLCRVDGAQVGSFDRVAGLLMTDADQRQALLEECDPMARAEAVLGHASNLLISLSRPTGPLN